METSLMKGLVVSNLPGRLRLVVPGLRRLSESREILARQIAGIPGIISVRITPITDGLLLFYDLDVQNPQSLLEETDVILSHYAMDAHRATVNQSSGEDGEETMTVSRLGRRLLINGIGTLLGHLIPQPILPRLSIEAITALGLSAPLTGSALEGLRKDLRPNADFLTVTSIIASLLLGNGTSALLILALSDIAELMTSYTIERTRSSIKEMLSVDEKTVWRLTDGRVVQASLEDVHKDDIIVVHTGEKIAVDGPVIRGNGLIDESAITGEFVPAEKKSGDSVFAGTLVKNGVLYIRAAKIGDQTVVSRIIGMVESSALKRAPIQRYADRFSNYLVPLNFLLFAVVYAVSKSPSARPQDAGH